MITEDKRKKKRGCRMIGKKKLKSIMKKIKQSKIETDKEGARKKKWNSK